MDIRPHDLLEIKSLQDLVSYNDVPEWVDASLYKAPFVVVRRANLTTDQIPVGIRGEARNERFAAFLPFEKILKWVSPEQLTEEKIWQTNTRKDTLATLQALPYITKILHFSDLSWGPTGSVGFELASGVPTVTSKSDLDLIMRTPNPLPLETAKHLLKQFEAFPIRVDVQLETPMGAISLVEYGHNKETSLIKTINGPRLIKTSDIW